MFGELLARQYAAGQAINMAATLEIDAVIDPADTRPWIACGLASSGCTPPPPSAGFVDTW